MLFTPNHNWPIPEDTDVVKQYPSTIDQPFKEDLDLLTPTEIVGGSILSSKIEFPGLTIIGGTHAPTTDSFGVFNVTFETPFDQTCHYVVASLGDDTLNGYIALIFEARSAAGFSGVAFSAGGAPAVSQITRISYVAFGV